MPNADDKKKIAYLGIQGSYSHQASIECFPDADYRGQKKFGDAFGAVQKGEVDYAMIPVENSSAGRVAEVYNLLPSVGLHIIGEYLLPIHHCFVVSARAFRGRLPHDMDTAQVLEWKKSPLTEAEKASAIAAVQEVRSHPQALMQCAGFLEKHVPKALTEAEFDTATAARAISAREDCRVAAIASRHAASIYGVSIVADNIEDDQHNMTRFLIFGREALKPESIKGPALTTLLFQTNHQPGALLGALKAFADNNVNLTKLETYMVSQERPDPTFYVDVGASLASRDMQKALAAFAQHTRNHRVLGCYPASADRGKRNSFLPVQ